MLGNSPSFRSSRILLYGALAGIIVTLMLAPTLRTTQGAGGAAQKSKKRGDILVSTPGEGDTNDAPSPKRRPAAKGVHYPNLDVRVNELETLARIVASNAQAVAKRAQLQAQSIQVEVARLKASIPGID